MEQNDNLRLYLDAKFADLSGQIASIGIDQRDSDKRLDSVEGRVDNLEKERDQRNGAERVRKGFRETLIGFFGVMFGGIFEFIANWFSGGHFHH